MPDESESENPTPDPPPKPELPEVVATVSCPHCHRAVGLRKFEEDGKWWYYPNGSTEGAYYYGGKCSRCRQRYYWQQSRWREPSTEIVV